MAPCLRSPTGRRRGPCAKAETLMRLVPADVPLVADLQIDTRDVARLRLRVPPRQPNCCQAAPRT